MLNILSLTSSAPNDPPWKFTYGTKEAAVTVGSSCAINLMDPCRWGLEGVDDRTGVVGTGGRYVVPAMGVDGSVGSTGLDGWVTMVVVAAGSVESTNVTVFVGDSCASRFRSLPNMASCLLAGIALMRSRRSWKRSLSVMAEIKTEMKEQGCI